MSCTTISQLWKRSQKEKTKGNKGYSFTEFVTLHNQGKLDAKYYNGKSVCPKTTVSMQYLPLFFIFIGAGLLGYAMAKK
jgi:hypothetical protein